MAINNEQAGERVFGNVDEALADRIISRSMENSGEPGRSGYCDIGTGRVDTNRINAYKPKQYQGLIIKTLIPAVLILIALWVYVKSKSKY
ncbi:hypothetical protein R80B4_00096 [Fibrobacteres bacterium R8-0-B4]